MPSALDEVYVRGDLNKLTEALVEAVAAKDSHKIETMSGRIIRTLEHEYGTTMRVACNEYHGHGLQCLHCERPEPLALEALRSRCAYLEKRLAEIHQLSGV